MGKPFSSRGSLRLGIVIVPAKTGSERVSVEAVSE
jgi:hypothetical protein